MWVFGSTNRLIDDEEEEEKVMKRRRRRKVFGCLFLLFLFVVMTSNGWERVHGSGGLLLLSWRPRREKFK